MTDKEKLKKLHEFLVEKDRVYSEKHSNSLNGEECTYTVGYYRGYSLALRDTRDTLNEIENEEDTTMTTTEPTTYPEPKFKVEQKVYRILVGGDVVINTITRIEQVLDRRVKYFIDDSVLYHHNDNFFATKEELLEHIKKQLGALE